MLDVGRINLGIAGEPPETMPWKQLVRGPIKASQVGRFATDLSRRDADVVRQGAKDLMEALGYE